MLFSASSVSAYNCPNLEEHCYKFKDIGLEEGEVISLSATEVHADFTFNNHWFNGVRGLQEEDKYVGFVDYRAEAHTALYNVNGHKGQLISRIEGVGFLDNDIKDFFDDRLIDIPELLFEDHFKVRDFNDTTFAFGKFANRRYFDKDEITPDSFDISERPLFGVFANTNSFINSVNSGRDSDHSLALNFNSTQATGSYGFAIDIKNKNPRGRFIDRWGYKQMLAVSRLDRFGDNFYGISEVNKNWGSNKYPGQFNLGFLYAADSEVFKIRSSGSNASFLTYTSFVQQFDKLRTYVRMGNLFSELGGIDYSDYLLSTGLFYQLTKKDTLTTHFLYRNSDDDIGNDFRISTLSFWRHEFNKNLASFLFVIHHFGIGNPSSFDGEDDNWSMGFNISAFF